MYRDIISEKYDNMSGYCIILCVIVSGFLSQFAPMSISYLVLWVSASLFMIIPVIYFAVQSGLVQKGDVIIRTCRCHGKSHSLGIFNGKLYNRIKDENSCKDNLLVTISGVSCIVPFSMVRYEIDLRMLCGLYSIGRLDILENRSTLSGTIPSAYELIGVSDNTIIAKCSDRDTAFLQLFTVQLLLGNTVKYSTEYALNALNLRQTYLNHGVCSDVVRCLQCADSYDYILSHLRYHNTESQELIRGIAGIMFGSSDLLKQFTHCKEYDEVFMKFCSMI